MRANCCAIDVFVVGIVLRDERPCVAITIIEMKGGVAVHNFSMVIRISGEGGKAEKAMVETRNK